MLMSLFTVANWPLLFIIAAMIVAAVIDVWKFKVPNWLTFPLVLSGWFLGMIYDLGLVTETYGSRSHVVASLAGTALGFALLLPVYAIGGMGAGDVKMTMGFGAWIGAFHGFWKGMTVVLYAFCAAAIIGGILALIMIFVRRQFQRNLENTREIVADLLNAPGLSVINQKAQGRKSRLHLLPYGVPLCLGFVGYLLFWQA
jgi:prepilin peptidase CpaA